MGGGQGEPQSHPVIGFFGIIVDSRKEGSLCAMKDPYNWARFGGAQMRGPGEPQSHPVIGFFEIIIDSRKVVFFYEMKIPIAGRDLGPPNGWVGWGV